jgi:hypothetical protein
MMALAVCLMTACEKDITSDDVIKNEEGLVENTANTKKFTFTLKGDFGNTWKQTRGYMQADGKDMTDIWVLDYMDGVLQQQKHLTKTDEDWAAPTMNLAYGTHHVYFIASRGQDAALDAENKIITWSKPSDTFYKDYEVTVVSSSNGNRAVNMDRCVTRFNATITDAIPDGCSTITIAPSSWHMGMNFETGEPITATASYVAAINIPSSYIGQTNTLLTVFGFSSSTEWTTDITITAKTSGNVVLGTATIENVPLKANRSSDYAGTLFGQSNSLSLTLNTDWEASYTETW